MRKLIVLVVVLGLAGWGGWYFWGGSGGRTQPAYRLAKVEQGRLIQSVTSTGSLSAVVTVQVGSQVSGQIKELLADFNSQVQADQVIARLDPVKLESILRQARAALAVAKANVAIQEASLDRYRALLDNAESNLSAAQGQVEKAEAALTDARQEYNRQKTLHAKKAVAKREVEQAWATFDQARAQLKTAKAQATAQAQQVASQKAQLEMAKAQVKHARAQVENQRAQVENAKIELDHTVIRSPVTGVVIERSVDVGQTVAASLQAPTLFTIAQDLRHMQVEASLDEADIGGVAVGQTAVFTVDAFPGREFQGRVEQIRLAALTVQNVVTYTVIISAENPDLKLLPGMTASVQIESARRDNVVKIPNAALRFRPTGQAQAAAAAAAGNSQGASGASQSDRRAAAESRFAKLAADLKLTDGQQQTLRGALANNLKPVIALRRAGAPAGEVKAAVAKMKRANDQAIRSVLRPEQEQAYLRLVTERTANPVRQAQVWVLNDDGRPEPVDIKIGITDGNMTELISGPIKAGQEVIIGQAKTGQQSKAAPRPRRMRF